MSQPDPTWVDVASMVTGAAAVVAAVSRGTRMLVFSRSNRLIDGVTSTRWSSSAEARSSILPERRTPPMHERSTWQQRRGPEPSAVS